MTVSLPHLDPEWTPCCLHCGLELVRERDDYTVAETGQIVLPDNGSRSVHAVCSECGLRAVFEAPRDQVEVWATAYRFGGVEAVRALYVRENMRFKVRRIVNDHET